MPVRFEWKGSEAMTELYRRGEILVDGVADEVLYRAQAECPVDTGDLRDSGIKIYVGAGHRVVAFPLFYAPFVEFGTKDHAPNPFLRRAVYATQGEAGVSILY
jgi:hypothetical protein